mgnify:CR=1 FL=1
MKHNFPQSYKFTCVKTPITKIQLNQVAVIAIQNGITDFNLQNMINDFDDEYNHLYFET